MFHTSSLTTSLPPLTPSQEEPDVASKINHAAKSPESVRESLASVQQFDRKQWEIVHEDQGTWQMYYYAHVVLYCITDDILENFLMEYRRKQSTPCDLVEDVPTLDNNSLTSFMIPELPQGQELVMKIWSTWGDRYYVGLTSIEIFTSSGEKAPINQVLN